MAKTKKQEVRILKPDGKNFFEEIKKVEKVPEAVPESENKLKVDDFIFDSPITFPSPKQIHKKLDRKVYGNSGLKRMLSVAVKQIENRSRFPELEIPKSNILIFGNTGSGKTYLVENLAKAVNIPLIKTKMTGLSSTGFVGGSISDVFSQLIDYNYDGMDRADVEMMIFNGDYDEFPFKEHSRYAIVYLDEIDKIANVKGGNFSEGLQDELIGYIEDCEVMDGEISTKDMLFIGTGAFVGLEKIILSRLKKTESGIGFSANVGNNLSRDQVLSKATAQDLIEYGFKPELAGRFPNMHHVEELTEDSLIGLMNMGSSYLSRQRKMLRTQYGVGLRVESGAKRYIATLAKESGTNARALQDLINRLVEPVIYDSQKYEGTTVSISENRARELLT